MFERMWRDAYLLYCDVLYIISLERNIILDCMVALCLELSFVVLCIVWLYCVYLLI